MPLADLREPEEWAEYARLWPVGDLVSHMLSDNWTFGLLLDNGMCFASTTSTQCEPPQMAQCGSMSVCPPERAAHWQLGNLPKNLHDCLIFAPTEGVKASVAVDKIAAAFEFASS
jgi:hypothetical protein